jgi:hypothetical protein
VTPGWRLGGGTALGLHLLLIVSNSLQDISWTPAGRVNGSARNERHSLAWEPFRALLTAYFDCTGIEAGYGFFAPAVPGNAKLGFELRYPDGHAEYDVPVVSGVGGGDRISALIDQLRFVHYVRLREALLRSLVDALHREHPAAITVRAVLGDAILTTPAEYRAGNRISYQPLFAYDFHYDKRSKPAPSP